MEPMFEGILPAIASPCSVDEAFLPDTFAALAEHLFEAGVHGLYVCGATGDGYKMRAAERKQAAELAVAAARPHHGTVIVHVGSPTNTRDAADLAAHAGRVGAAAVSSIPPARCGQAQLRQYYADVAEAAGIPVFIYHIPILTGTTPTVEEMIELLDIPGVVGLKYTDWNLFFMRRLLLARPDIRIFNGFDEFLCPGLLYGAHGGIGTWYNLFPKLYLGIFDAVRAGCIDRAMTLQKVLIEFCELGWAYGVGGVFELLMQKRGFGPYCSRRPRYTLEPEAIARIEPELNERVAAIEAAVAAGAE